MAFDKTLIGNLALSHVGDARINDYEDQTKEGREVRLWYDVSREQTLETFNWNFARKRVALSLASQAAPTDVWAFRYQYPADCLRMRWLVNPSGRQNDRIPYQIEIDDNEQKTILTNLDDACLVYTRNLTNVALFTPSYIAALSHLLASRMGKSVGGGVKTQIQQLQMFQVEISAARASNANETAEAPPIDADIIVGRSGGTDFSPTAQVDGWNLPGATG
jgi:hypothetical protein